MSQKLMKTTPSKFIDDYMCKPMDYRFEDVIQSQSNLQEMHL